MNFNMSNFKKRNPSTKEEKLVCELYDYFIGAMKTFVKMNASNTTDQEMFVILRDSALAYAGQLIEFLCHLLKDKSQVKILTKECHDIFNCYLNEIEKSYE